ncbi:hypothetical protein PsalMR5_00574 [Piscirickettsia salmonis]|nr:hypothetical protein PsalSR1_00573 [Piscirickettsia salmonis]QGP60896.1 hypothetical protein PsalBI1_03518 [Piscirickettsia salmonis]QGP62736.1 hypothetical protein PsalMR5_00574 [Piscirickettsia salmonis]
MPKKIFVYDIDETLLTCPKSHSLINKVPNTRSHYSVYGSNYPSYTINRDKIAELMQAILMNNSCYALNL